MTELTSSTTFSVLAAPEHFEESEDLYLFPENAGSLALRELRYPNDLLPPLIYWNNPDRWENFDSAPMTDRPQVKTEMTIGGNQIVQWTGYVADRPVKEYWKGSDTRSRVTAYFLRRLYEYFTNPPESGYITWHPKDRTEEYYNVILESVQVGGQDIVTFDFIALYQGEVMPLEVVVQFRIVGVAG
jgi:hypothetical protein